MRRASKAKPVEDTHSSQLQSYLQDNDIVHIKTIRKTMDPIIDLVKEDPAVAIVGAIGLYYVSKAVTHLFKTFLRPGKNLKKLGEWAVVTGATGE